MWHVIYKLPDGLGGEFVFAERPDMVAKVVELLGTGWALRLVVELR